MTITKSNIIKTLLLLFLVFAGLHYAKAILMPLTIAGVLATLFFPFCKWMEGKKVPKGLAVLICVLILLIIIAGVSLLLGWQISNLAKDFPLIKQKSITILDRIQDYIFNHSDISAEEQFQIIKEEQPSYSNIFQTIIGSFTYIFTNLLFTLVYLFCFLYYRSHIKQFILKLTSSADRLEMEQVIYNAALISQQYLVGLSKMIVCLWIMYSIGFSILGVKHAFFFALLCGLLEIVPYIGNILGTSLTVFVSAGQGASVQMLGGIIIVYGIVQLIQGWILEPLIVGHQVKINPFTTIIALVIGELVWGIPGIFLAIPLIAMIKIACDHIEPLKPYGFLIGPTESKKKKKQITKT
ncbi:MAG: AI-2E family transporter [Bacteroidetes bacterium]|nr:AI-2E family transporter [Bacteroidota bacterium]